MTSIPLLSLYLSSGNQWEWDLHLLLRHNCSRPHLMPQRDQAISRPLLCTIPLHHIHAGF